MLRIAFTALVLTAALGCDPVTPSGSVDTFEPDTDVKPADCREIYDGRVICFPEGQVCYDPHGIGDGVPVVIDCYTSGSRMCHPNSDTWPECAGGWEQE